MRFKGKIPATLVGGFLGAGKTTLVNHLISSGGRRYGVLVNEFGDLNVDAALIETLEGEGVAELEGGCLCCVGREDLAGSLYDLICRKNPPEYILIELSGLADPVPVAQQLLTTELRGLVELDSIVAVADARNLESTLKDNPEGSAQLAYASVVVLNKADLIQEDDLTEARRLVSKLNPLTEIVPATHCDVEAAEITGLKGFDPSWKPKGHVHIHDQTVNTVTLRSEDPLELGYWVAFHETMIMNRTKKVYRAKGILHFRELDDPMVLQAVRDLYTFDIYEGRTNGISELVIIGRDLDEADYREAFGRVSATTPVTRGGRS